MKRFKKVLLKIYTIVGVVCLAIVAASYWIDGRFPWGGLVGFLTAFLAPFVIAFGRGAMRGLLK